MQRNKIPHLKDCIAYIESCGYKYSHKSIIRSYVFYRITDNKQVAFDLPEIRHTLKYGW
jgi:hypothetical protein